LPRGAGSHRLQCAALWLSWHRLRLPELRHSLARQRGDGSGRLAGGRAHPRARTEGRHPADAAAARASTESRADRPGDEAPVQARRPRSLPRPRQPHESARDHARGPRSRPHRQRAAHRGPEGPGASRRLEPAHRHHHRRRSGMAGERRRQSRGLRSAPSAIVQLMTSRIGRLFACAAACLLFFPLPGRAQATITILHFNDVYEITPVEAGKAGGLARLARFRADLKAAHPGLITMLGGDYVAPSALGTARVAGERLNGRQMVAVLNALGLDWATFGNHEFDIPDAALRARLPESQFRMVSSNVTDGDGALFPNTVRSAVIAAKTPAGTVRLGLLGLTIDANRQPSVRYAPPVEAARAAVAELKAECDVIVALTHLALSARHDGAA